MKKEYTVPTLPYEMNSHLMSTNGMYLGMTTQHWMLPSIRHSGLTTFPENATTSRSLSFLKTSCMTSSLCSLSYVICTFEEMQVALVT